MPTHERIEVKKLPGRLDDDVFQLVSASPENLVLSTPLTVECTFGASHKQQHVSCWRSTEHGFGPWKT